MSFWNFLFGHKPKVQQATLYQPQQNTALDQLMKMGMSNADFGPIAQQAQSQFYGSTIPTLAERFSSMGSGGSQQSSAFQGALGSAGAGLEEQLAALRSQYGMQQLGMGMKPRFENMYMQGQPGMVQQTMAGGMQGLAQMLPFLMML